MRTMIAAAATIMLSGAAVAAAPQLEDLSGLDARIGAFLAQAFPGGAGQVQPLDRRLRMTRCPVPATIEMPLREELVVRCAATGWRLRVPVVAPLAAKAEVVIRRGDNVTLAVGGSGFSIVSAVVALEDGREGGMVRVKSSTGSSTMTARVEGPGRVALAD